LIRLGERLDAEISRSRHVRIPRWKLLAHHLRHLGNLPLRDHANVSRRKTRHLSTDRGVLVDAK
jgi:hypothetical protein